MKKGKGKFNILNYLNAPEKIKDKLFIEIKDNLSRTRFLKLELSKRSFIDAIQGSIINCKFELSTKLVGQKKVKQKQKR